MLRAPVLLLRQSCLGILSHGVRALKDPGHPDAPEPLVAEMERLAPEILGRELSKPRELWLRALDPAHFVAIRDIPGGPAPEAVRAQIAVAEREQAEAQEWLHAKRSLLDQYSQLMQNEILALKNASTLPGRA